MTERVLFDADESVVADLRKLTSQASRSPCDDFGTGYASLSYLQRFPISTLKIDRSFVSGVGITTTDTAIVDSIVALARALNLDVVAEGVETEAQLEQLLDHECAKAQGYYFAPPLDAADFEVALMAQSGRYSRIKQAFRYLQHRRSGFPGLKLRQCPDERSFSLRMTFRAAPPMSR